MLGGCVKPPNLVGFGNPAVNAHCLGSAHIGEHLVALHRQLPWTRHHTHSTRENAVSVPSRRDDECPGTASALARVSRSGPVEPQQRGREEGQRLPCAESLLLADVGEVGAPEPVAAMPMRSRPSSSGGQHYAC